MYRGTSRTWAGVFLAGLVVVPALGQEPASLPKNQRQLDLRASDGSRLTITSPIVLEKKGREHPPAVVRVVAPPGWVGKRLRLRRGKDVIADGVMQPGRERAVAELQFDALPTCLHADELDLIVDGATLGRIAAPLALVGMRGNPPTAEVLAALAAPGDDLFPLVDEFGQYRHRNWPDKTHSIDDLKRFAEREAEDRNAHPAPDEWNEYGGWQGGPQLDATGHFRVAKHQGKWWLIDPAGRLFWSHGTDCVRPGSGTTPVTHREAYFSSLPKPGSPLTQFYSRGYWAPHGFYHGRGKYEMFNFTAANLWRKYGDRWRETSGEMCHRRLHSWGLNTIGNWSEPAIYLMRKTPYVATVGANSRPIEGSEGYWGKFPDPFDPSLRESLRDAMAKEQGRAAGDPWCIGIFVHNELAWGSDGVSLAKAALASPADQPAKVAFVDWLRKKYENIGDLNEAWNTSHESWRALLDEQQAPSHKGAIDDLAAFYTEIARQYFRVCRGEVKRAAPDNLYLGCRFAWVNDRAARAAGEFCDVVGYNRYRPSVADFKLPEGVDKPVIIGEFHFGALDRGMLHPGLIRVENQAARAEAYKNYVRGALDHPQIVGTHWFLFGSQATTGRGDGENYQIGLVDICDTPYWETINACREMGHAMYGRRLAAEPPPK